VSSPTYAKFSSPEPFEAANGHTVGNSLRRVLLSSIEGAAISSIKYRAAWQHRVPEERGRGRGRHPTSSLTSRKSSIVLPKKRERRALANQGPTARVPSPPADIQPDAAMQIVNPEQLICHPRQERPFEAEIEIKTGRGPIAPGETTRRRDQPIGVFRSIRSSARVRLVPITTVENTRGRPDHPRGLIDKLILESGPMAASRPTTPSSSPPLDPQMHHLDVFRPGQRGGFRIPKPAEHGSAKRRNKLRQDCSTLSVKRNELSVARGNCLEQREHQRRSGGTSP